MKPTYEDNHITLYGKSCLDMAEIEDETVQMVVTSPPYWGLRKYSGEQDLIWGGQKDCQHEWSGAGDVSDVRKDEVVAGKSRTEERFLGDESRKFNGNHQKHYQDNVCQVCGAWRGSYGLEPTPEMYVQHTIEILREVRRVLRKDGVVFWNIGDSYFGGGNNKGGGEFAVKQARNHGALDLQDISENRGKQDTLKTKDLCLIPFRVAIALQDDGWWVRSDIIWAKPNPMPESVTDRPTNSHEYILMLTKSSKYYWDADAVRGPVNPNNKGKVAVVASGDSRTRDKEHWGVPHEAKVIIREYSELKGRNLRSVWEFPTQPYPEAHFAVFPEKLPELCIKAATPEVGCCSKCGAPWTRVMEKGSADHGADTESQYEKGTSAYRLAKLRQSARAQGDEYANETKTIGWKPQCKCDAEKVPSIILDPFAGAGTSLWVAKKLNRKAVGYELSSEYCDLIIKRNSQQVMT